MGISSVMVGAANSDSAIISFLGGTEGGLARELDRGSTRCGSSALRTARDGRLLHGSRTLPHSALGGTYLLFIRYSLFVIRLGPAATLKIIGDYPDEMITSTL
jgi:hypothetical protein